MEGRRKTNGTQSLETVFALNELAMLTEDQGDLIQALAHYQEALAIARRVAPASPDLARILNNLGSLQELRGDLAAAETGMRESLAMRRALYGNEDANTLRVEHNLCRVLMVQGQRAAAHDCAADVHERRRKVLGEASPEVDDSRGLVEVLQPTPERDWLQDRYEHYRQQGPAQILRAMRFAWLLASVRGEESDLQRLASLAKGLREAHGAQSVSAALTELAYAELAWLLGRPDAMREALARAEPILDAALAPEASQRRRMEALQRAGPR